MSSESEQIRTIQEVLELHRGSSKSMQDTLGRVYGEQSTEYMWQDGMTKGIERCIEVANNLDKQNAALLAESAPGAQTESEIGGGSLKAQAVVRGVPQASRESDTGGESYPGQAWFHEHNPRIKAAELAREAAPTVAERDAAFWKASYENANARIIELLAALSAKTFTRPL